MSDPDSLSPKQRALLDAVPSALEDGVALLEWWQKADPAMDYETHYQETAAFNRPDDKSYGFFDSVELSGGRKIRINGNVQEMFYDEPKAPPGYEGTAVDWMDEQVREFILRYFMRVSDYRQPQPAEDKGDGQATGFGFSQLYSKRRADGEIVSFADHEQDAIVDLRKFADELDWVVLKNPIFSFGFDFAPLGASGPQLKVPAKVFNYLVMSPDFVVHEEKPEPGIRGRYGFGYAFLDDPEPSVFGYGPGRLEPAFEQMVWTVHDSGKITVRAAFVAEEPGGILNLSVDPMVWILQFAKVINGQIPDALRPVKRVYDQLPLTNVTFDPVLPTVRLLNLVTAGQADRFISKERIIKQALFVHFLQHYQTIVGSLQTWRQIPDWKASEDKLPAFVVSGKSS